MEKVVIIGAGLAGCEAALRLSQNGYKVTLYDNKNVIDTTLYHKPTYAELVCMNTLGGLYPNRASGLCRIELEALRSRMIDLAYKSRVKNNSFLAVDKDKFSRLVTKELYSSGVEILDENITDIPNSDIVILSSGPNTSVEFMNNISSRFNNQPYYISSSLVPAIYENTIDFDSVNIHKLGDNIYKVNIPEDVVNSIISILSVSKPTHVHLIDKEIDTSVKKPVELLALEDPESFKKNFSSLIIEKDPVLYGVYNIKGFYTRIGIRVQEAILRIIPGFENVEFARYGLMHKDTYFHSPGFLNNYFKVKDSDNVYIIGQLSGCDGYLRAFGSAIIATNNIISGDVKLSNETYFGALADYISNEKVIDFQPMSANFALINCYTNPFTQEEKSISLIKEYNRQLKRTIN